MDSYQNQRNEKPGFERYSRQMLFAPIGKEGQAKLAGSAVLIVGMGALGTVLANHMVRSGVGLVRFVDRDYVERSNLQRQMLYDEDDAAEGLPKAEAARRRLSRINPDVRLDAIVSDVTALNAESLLSGIELVLDGTDNFRTRMIMNDACFKHGVPFVYGGAVSSNGMTAAFLPGETCCFRCLMGSGEVSGPTCDMVGVISPIVDIVASFQAVEALKLLVRDYSSVRRSLLSLEVWRHQLFDMKLPPPNDSCPTCGTRQYPALEPEADSAQTLCGRETVQMNGAGPLDLLEWESKLGRVCVSVSRNPFLLRAELPEGERLVLFPDGRVLVQGTEDVARARTLYDRYIGS